MKFEQSFVIEAPRDVVWKYFEEEATVVGMCIPGAESVEPLGNDKYRVIVTQKVGSIGATFDLKAEIREKEPNNKIHFSAIGRSVKGARGDLRAKATVDLSEHADGTQVELLADVALGGMLGSLGHKVIVQKAEEVTRQFAVTVTSVIQEGGSS